MLDTLTKGEPGRAAAASTRALPARWGPPGDRRGLGVPRVGRTPAAGRRSQPGTETLAAVAKSLQLPLLSLEQPQWTR